MKFRLLAVAAAALIPGLASALTATATLPVTASVVALCTVTASGVSFGEYDQFAGAANDSTGSLSVACTSGSAYTIALSTGANAAAGARQMASGANRLGYELYSNVGRTQSWGSDAGAPVTGLGADTVSGTGTGATQTLTVYGRIPTGQAKPVGAYTDSVAVTLTY